MKEILKPIFELIIGEFTLFGDVLYNYIALGVIGTLAFVIAFRLVGKIYDSGIISSRAAGSFLHWTIRLVVFTVFFYIFSLIIWLVKFIATIPQETWFIIGAVGLLAITLIIIFKVRKISSTKNTKQKEE